jgi:hypothetical protein
MTVEELAAAVAALPELSAVERARSATRLLAVARQVLQWEQGEALAEAKDAGWSEAQLGRELGVPAVKVTALLADHARARAAGERAAAGQRPVNRSRAARQLAQRLTAAAQVPVEIRWDSSGASSRRGRGWAYHVDWSDGPTRTGMRDLVDQLVDQAAGDGADPIAGLDPAELVYVRTVQPAAVALAMLGNVTAGQPALGGRRHAYALERALEDVEHPERGTAEALQLATRLGRLSGWNTDRMAELLDKHGLAALTGQLDPDPGGTVVPLARPAGQGRWTR